VEDASLAYRQGLGRQSSQGEVAGGTLGGESIATHDFGAGLIVDVDVGA